MDRITLTGIEAFGHHGVLAHERQFGQRFVADVVLELDLTEAGATDRLEATVDYGALVAEVTGILTGEPVDLIEALAERIAGVCLTRERVRAVEVTVHKPGAPVPGLATEVAVTIRRTPS